MKTSKEMYDEKLMEIIHDANKKSNLFDKGYYSDEDAQIPLSALASSTGNFFAKFGSSKQAYESYQIVMDQSSIRL